MRNQERKPDCIENIIHACICGVLALCTRVNPHEP